MPSMALINFVPFLKIVNCILVTLSVNYRRLKLGSTFVYTFSLESDQKF